jgi:cell filamentation protein
MYDVEVDPYSYPGTSVLKNKLDLKDADDLAEFEAEITNQRALEPLPEGNFDYEHYRSLHHHLFQDVYDWAGESQNTEKGKYSSSIRRPTTKSFHLFGASPTTWAE